MRGVLVNHRQGRNTDGPPMRAAVMLSLGFQLLTSALAGFIAGAFIDRLRTTRWAAPTGLLVGLVAGFHRAYLLVKSTIAKRK